MTHMITKSVKCFAAAALLLFLAAVMPSAVWAGDATDNLKGTLDSILKVLLDPALKQTAQNGERHAKVDKLLRERFDEYAFSKRALGKHWGQYSQQEQEEFVQLFSQLLINTYLDKIDSYLGSLKSFTLDNIQYIDEKKGKTYTVVSTNVLLDNANKIPVMYRMEQRDGNWLVTDIAIEGVSLLKNYRVQFNEILAGSDFKHLIQKLKSKQIENAENSQSATSQPQHQDAS